MAISDEERSLIREEGRQAAILGRKAFACPYLSTDGDDRFGEWIEGYVEQSNRLSFVQRYRLTVKTALRDGD